MQVFDPSRAYNAFTAGAQLGGAMRQQETERMAAPAISAGDYGKAAEIYGQRGDVAGAAGYRQMYEQQLAQMDEKQKAEARNRTEGLARLGSVLREINTTTETGQPVEDLQGRFAALQQNAPFLSAMGIPIENIGPDQLTNQNLDMIMAQVTEMGNLLKAQAPVTLSPGAALYTPGGEMLAQNVKPADEPQTAIDAQGVRRYLTGPSMGQPVPGFETPRQPAQQPSFGVQIGEGGAITGITYGSGPAMETARVPAGYVRRQNPDGSTYLEPEPGSPAAIEAQGAATAKKSLDNTFANIMLSYLDLQEMGAIRDVEKGPLENVGAFVRSSPLGRLAGKFTGTKAESLRETIEALQPAITQAIMSQPGMSARSMDSQRELEFFMRSITTPKADVWANFATLYALDLRFGSGQLMASMLRQGRITPEDFAKITRSPKVNSVINQVEQKVNELFVTPGGGGMGGLFQSAIDEGLTPEEQAELEALRAELGMQ